MQEYIFNKSIIPSLTKELNHYLSTRVEQTNSHGAQYQKRLKELSKSRENIIEAIAMTGYSDIFSDKLKQIDSEIATITKFMHQSQQAQATHEITEAMVTEYFSQFQTLIEQRNLPQLKRLIDSFVERVDIYPDTIKVTFKVAFSFWFEDLRNMEYLFTVSTEQKSSRSA